MEVTVAADGSVAEVSPDAALPPAMRAALQRGVSTWRFEVPEWLGSPVSLQTRLGLRIKLVPVAAGGFALRVLGRIPAPSPDARLPPPAYPGAAMRHGVGGDFVYALRVDAAGHVTDARLLSPGRRLRGDLAELDAAARDAFAQWTLSPIVAGGLPRDCYRLMPIRFQVGESARMVAEFEPEQWSDYATQADGLVRCPVARLRTAIAGMPL